MSDHSQDHHGAGSSSASPNSGGHSGGVGSELDAYVDGLLDNARRATFEQRVQQDSALAVELQRQQAADDELRRICEPPAGDRVFAAVEQAVRERSPRAARQRKHVVFRIGRPLAVAASIVVALIGVYRIARFLLPEDVHVGSAIEYVLMRQTMEQAWAAREAVGFKPGWVCRTDKQFATTFESRLGQPLLIGETPEDVTALGLGYGHVISKETMYVLVRVGKQHAIVFVDRAKRDPGQQLPPDSPHQLFSRRIGDLVLYEMTPLNEPKILDHFYQPQPPYPWQDDKD